MSKVSAMERKVCAMPKGFRDWFAEYYHATCSGEGRSLSDEEVQIAIDTWNAATASGQPVGIPSEVLDFAKKVADSSELCDKAFMEMQEKRDINAKWGQSKEYQDAYHAHNVCVNVRHDLLRDNHAKIEQMARALILASKRESSAVARIKAAAHEARGYLCARPANKPKANTILLRIVQGAYDNSNEIEGGE